MRTVPIDLSPSGIGSALGDRLASPSPAEDRLEDARELGPAEALTNQAHLLGALMAGGLLKISGPLTPELVRRGLDWLQDEHPILRAHVVRKGLSFSTSLPYVQPRAYFVTKGTEPIPLRLAIDPDPAAGDRVLQEELRKPIPVGPLPRMKAALVRPSEHAEIAQLIFCVDHTIADVQSAMHSIGQLLEFFADPDSAPPPRGRQSRLPPALDTLLPPKTDSGRPYEPMIRLPATKSPKTGIGTAVDRRRFSKAETGAIKSQVRSHRTTIHGLVSAAVLKGIHERFGLPEMTVLSSVDLRRQCRPAVPRETYGCYIDVLRTRHRIDQPLWALSQDVAFGLITALARDHQSASALSPPSWAMLRAELVPMIRTGFRGDGLVITTAGEINLRTEYGPFRLEDMTGMIAQETMGAGFFCMVMEREGALEVSLCHAPHCLPKGDAAAVADGVDQTLRNLPA